MRRKLVSLDNLSEQQVSWLYYISNNKTQLRQDPKIKLLIDFLREITPEVLTNYESDIFWGVTDGKCKLSELPYKYGVNKSIIYRTNKRACTKLKPFAKAFIKILKIKSISGE